MSDGAAPVILSAAKDLMPIANAAFVDRAMRSFASLRTTGYASSMSPVLIRDWPQMKAALETARHNGETPTLVTPEDAASLYGAGYLAALQDRARREFPDVAFTLVVDCGDTPGYALACLRAGVRCISMREPNEKIADIARQMGADLVRRPT
jgi:hypothetical protein